MGMNMFSRNDERSNNASAGPSSRSRFDYYYNTTSSPSSSVENQRYNNDQTSLFGDPVLPATRHTDLLEGGDLYQNLKNNIELYHSKLYNQQEKLRQAERDQMFNEFTTQRGSSSVTTSSSGAKHSLGSSKMMGNFAEDPVRRFQRTQSASLGGMEAIGNRPALQNMDLLKHNDWINFSEYEYHDSLIPKTNQTVAEVQQFTSNNLNRTIENGVFQNPRVAALKSRRSSMSENLYAPSTISGYEVVDKLKPSTFTILGHGSAPYDGSAYFGGSDIANSAEAMSEYERMVKYHKLDATKPIITDKITTGSNFRVSEGRQHKKPAFTIINENLPKSSSFDVSPGPFLPYEAKQRLAATRILSASSVGTSAFLNRRNHQLNLTADEPFLAHQRRFSQSDVSPTSVGKRRKSVIKKGGGEGKKSKSKNAVAVIPNPNRKQRGVLGIFNRATRSPSKQHPHVKSAKLTVTGASEDGQSSPTPSELTSDVADIPDHQVRNMKLFLNRPFPVRPMLSPVQDKSSMESSQVDLKEASPAKGKDSHQRTPMFNIRGFLSPGRFKTKSESPTRAEKGGLASVGEAMNTALAAAAIGDIKRADSKEKQQPPKRSRFNLARAIIDYGKKSDPEEETKKEKEEPAKPRPEVKRDGRRKDSEGNRVKDKKDSKSPKKKGTKTKPKSKKAGGKDDHDDYYEEDEKPKRGMLRGALNLASSLTARGGSKKGSTKEPIKARQAASGKRAGEKSATTGTNSRTTAGARSGKASERTNQRAGEKSAKAGAKSTPKSAVGPKGKQIRRSSSASALNVDSVKKLNRLYEKNAKAGDRNGKILKGQDKKSRQSSDSLLKKADSRGELKQKTGSKSATEKGIEKRDSEKSLKKSDSNKSILKGGKRSDSKGSLIGKRSDSKTSLHQTEAMALIATTAAELPGSSGGAKSDADPAKTPLNTMNEPRADSGVKSTKVTPTPTKKLQSKGSLLSLLSMRSSTRKATNVENGTNDSRPGTAQTGIGRLKSASVRNVNEKPGTPTDGDSGSQTSIPGSSKFSRRGILTKNNSFISMKSIVHARSFINIRPSSKDGDLKKNDSMPQMSKVQEGSQEHDEADEGGLTMAMRGGGGTMTTTSATHTMTVAGVGEGQKVSNEYSEQRGATGQSPEMDLKGDNPDMMGNQSSANTDSMMMQRHQGEADNSDEFNETGKSKCCTCCAPCWTKTCLPFKRCFSCSSPWCGKCRGKGGKNPKPKPEAKQKTAGGSFWQRLNCCRSCRRSKTSPAEAQPAATPKKSCWQSLNCCASCRRNKSRELVPRSSIDSEPEEKTSRCRSCWSRLLCCSRFRKGADGQLQRHKMQEEPVEMETVKCCFCFKRNRAKKKPKPKKKKPQVKSSFNCLSCCIMCCPKKGDNGSRRTSNFSKKQSIAPTIPPEDLRPKIDMSLVEHSSMMRGAIPILPICLAYFCLILNVVIPGLGTILSGGLCLCIGKPRFSQHDSIKGRIGSFIINCIVGVSQCFTIIFCVVGWGWAIWWGTIMVRLAKQHRKILETEAAQREGEEQTTLSQGTGASNPPVALVSQNHHRDVETGR
ncbi:protein stum [Ochlerotatus camptorhynchus]|uniref:protein stum n=1 Tax=Ochlerotatus camptorhynchus TaxID=644619 RepID=UPI0031E27A47